MNNTENNQENQAPLPMPASETKPPKKGWRQYRMVIILGLILLFMVYIFAAKEYRRVEQSTPPGAIVAKQIDLEKKPLAGVLHGESKSKSDDRGTIPDKPVEATVPSPPEAEVKHEKPTIPVTPGQPEAPQPKHQEPLARPAMPTAPPIPPAAEKIVSRPVKGEAFTRALIKILDDQVNESFFGWRPNSILFGKMGLTDNVNNLQMGVLEVARRTTVVLNENMSRFALTEAQNVYLNNAMNFIMVSPEKYWFPSASGKYKEAMANLEQYIDDLKHNRSRFYTRVDNLIALMTHFRDVLGSAFHNLIKDTEADGSSVSSLVCDDYFYFAQGVALSMAEILEGVKEDFADQLARKNSSKLVDDAIHALHTGAHLSPWYITNAAKDGILANHRANMATYIGEGEHIIFTLMNVLATN